ncbi:hypothetical protein [Nonomuraea sp. NPDC050783]|uniref:hypothetical protein n=1 Tax=Nonomuraea sp. NPDC050783 TaxID=3154634 RepID=UPI0034671106
MHLGPGQDAVDEPEPAGKGFAIEAIFVLTVRNGRISEIRAVSDRLGLFFQLGWDWPEAA